MDKISEYNHQLKKAVDEQDRDKFNKKIKERNDYINEIENEEEKLNMMMLAQENDRKLMEYMKKTNEETKDYSIKQVNKKRAAQIYDQY